MFDIQEFSFAVKSVYFPLLQKQTNLLIHGRIYIINLIDFFPVVKICIDGKVLAELVLSCCFRGRISPEIKVEFK